MNYGELQYLIALANLAVAVAIVIICGCRIDVMSRRTKLHVQLVYGLLLTSAACSGLQPLLFHEMPGRADLLMNASVLGLLLAGRSLWPKAVPECYTRPAELDESRHVHVVGGKGGAS